jgi:hypothetical protein
MTQDLQKTKTALTNRIIELITLYVIPNDPKTSLMSFSRKLKYLSLKKVDSKCLK